MSAKVEITKQQIIEVLRELRDLVPHVQYERESRGRMLFAQCDHGTADCSCALARAMRKADRMIEAAERGTA